MTSVIRKRQEALENVKNTFPELPMAVLKKSALDALMMKIMLYRRKQDIQLMQQQAWIGEAFRNT